MAVGPVAGPVLGLVGGILGKIGQKRQQRRNIRDQTAANKELAEFAYGKDLEQWERQNLYNSPTEQMARLRDAGLNPNLVYGSGSAAGVTSPSTSPKYQTVRADYSKRQSPLEGLDMLGQYQDFVMKNAQIDLVKSEAEYGERYFRGRATGVGYRGLAERREYKYGMRIEDGQTRSNLYRYKDYQLQAKEQLARGYQAGAGLKEIELAWLETLKTMGVLGKGFNILRMIKGR